MDNTDHYDVVSDTWCCFLCKSTQYHKPGGTEACRKTANRIRKSNKESHMDIANLNRSPEYWEGLDSRLGFKASDGKALLVHVAGVTMTPERKEIISRLRDFCSFTHTPPVELRPDPNNQYDENAVEVWVGFGIRDDLTGEYPTKMCIGFLPKRRCPDCARNLTGRKSDDNICPDCQANFALGLPNARLSYFNKYYNKALSDGKKVEVGLDTVTESQSARSSSLGVDLWIRIED